MKFKIFLIIMILLIGIAAVSGENTTATFEDVQNAINSDDNDIIYLNNTNYIGNGAEITITKDIILDGSYSNGTGLSTLDANNLSRIFNIKNTNLVVLKNINFINGNALTNGGAISFDSEGLLIICNSNFTNNHAENGGAIYSNGIMQIYDGYFTNNSGIDSNGTIHSENNLLSLKDTYFNGERDGIYIKDAEFAIPGIIEEDTEITIDQNPLIQANPLGLIGSKDYYLLMYNPLYNGTFPTSFDLRTYGYTGPIRNQGSTGTCWAQSTISALESCILKATNGDQVFLQNTGLSVQNMVEDVIKYIYPTTYYSGGKFDWSIPYLISWLGPTYEENQPWGSSYEAKVFNSVVHVQNLLNIQHRQNFTDLNRIKQALMDYGGIFTTIYASGPSGPFGNCFNYYNTQVDHGICVIGWDDKYSKYNFLPVNGYLPEGDGAFIVQNSWGANWGHKGFYYVSYYDRTIFASDDSWTFIFNDTVRYNKNYQNSIKGKIASGISGKKISSSETFISGGNDYLAAVSAYFLTPSTYELTISVNGKTKLTQTGEKTSTGYFTIGLEEFIPLTVGDQFTIKITYTGLDGARVNAYNTIEGYPAIKAYTTESIFESIRNKLNYAEANTEVFLEGKTFASSTGDSPITINRNLIINGANENGEGIAVLDGKGLQSIMKIENKCNVTVKNVKMINALNTAISVDYGCSLLLVNCEFGNNKGRFGNALSINGNVILRDCVITNTNTGLCEIYVVGTAYFENNKITSAAPPIYNAGTITSKTILIFGNATASVGKTVTLTASLTDDNGNPIRTSKINVKDIGTFDCNDKGEYKLEFTPKNGISQILTCDPKGFTNITVQEGYLKVLDGEPMRISGGKAIYGNAPTVSIKVDESKYGIYNLYVDGVKTDTCFITSSNTVITVKGLSVGVHTITLEYGTNKSYFNTTTVEISKINPSISLNVKDITYGIETVISITATGYRGDNLNDTLKIIVGNNEYSLDLIDGKGSLELPALLDEGTYSVSAIYDEKDYYNQVTVQKTFNVRKATPTTTLYANPITYGDSAVLIATLNKKIEGNISFYVDKKLVGTSPVINGRAQLSVNGLDAGSHTTYAIYEGTTNYNSANSGQKTLVIDKKQLKADIITADLTYSKNPSLYVSLSTSNYVGYIYLTLNDNISMKKLSVDGSGKFALKDLKPGTYTGIVTCDDTKNFNKITQPITFTIEKLDYDLKYNVIGGHIGNITLNINCPKDDTATVEITLNNTKYTLNPINGMIVLNLDDHEYGKYNMTIKYSGENYKVKEIDRILTIKPSYKMEFENVEMFFQDGTRLEVKVVDLNNIPMTYEKTTIKLNNEVYTRTTDAEGKIYMNLNLKAGDYVAEVTCKDLTEEVNITVKSTIIGENLVKYFHNETQYYITIVDTEGTPLENITVNYNINGVFYTRTTNENGTAKFNINLGPGKYIITLQNTHNGEISANEVEVLPTIIASDLTKIYKNESQYWVKIVDGAGNPLEEQTVTYNINGVIYTRTTDEDGMARFNINLAPGKYIITVMHGECIISNVIHVLSNVFCEDLLINVNNRTPFVVTTLDDAGNALGGQNISLNVNGIIYYRTTKDNGTASLNMNLAPGEYIITVEYNNLLTSKIVRIVEEEKEGG